MGEDILFDNKAKNADIALLWRVFSTQLADKRASTSVSFIYLQLLSTVKHFLYVPLVIVCSVFGYAQPLQGTYVIGDGVADYEEIYDAVEALNANGISGPTVFELKSGVFNQYISISEIAGSSLQNTVTFRSQSGNPEDVIWKDNHASGNNHTLKLSGADNLIFENLSIKCIRQNPGDNQFSRVLVLSGDANNIIFRGNILQSFNVGYQVNYHNDCIYVNSSTGNQQFCDSISFIDNVIIGGYGGLSFAGVAMICIF